VSPEEATGGTVDRRTDIWALGCVLYEMRRGCRAFEGDTTSQVLARVIEREPIGRVDGYPIWSPDGQRGCARDDMGARSSPATGTASRSEEP
jgi:eukaryotic-like serine/threonine-protein kinase